MVILPTSTNGGACEGKVTTGRQEFYACDEFGWKIKAMATVTSPLSFDGTDAHT